MIQTSDESVTDTRFQKRHVAEFKVRFKSYDEFFSQYTENISQGGLFIRTDRVREVDQVIRLWLHLPGETEEVEILGRVAHVRSPETAASEGKTAGMGVEFLEMPFEQKQQLNDYFLGGLSDVPSEGSSPKPKTPQRVAGRVLIVEDDGLLQRKIRKLLESKGMEIDVASTGVEAIKRCMAQAPDLILSDIEMPTLDGWGLLRMVKARKALSAIPFVFLTSRASETNRLKGYRQGVEDFLSKSTPPAEIIARLDRILSRVHQPSRDSAASWGLGGDLRQMGLPTLLQMLELERKSGVLEVVGEDGAVSVRFNYGQAVTAELMPDGLSGTEAIFRMLDWQTGRFKFRITEVSDTDEICSSVSGLLMEHARVRDEENR